MIKKIVLYIKSSLRNPRTIKFTLVGASGVLVNMGMLFVLTEYLKLFYMYSSAIAIEISILTNYFLNDSWTWQDRVKQPWPKRIGKYHFVSLAASLANWLVLVLLKEKLAVYYMTANLIGIAVGMSINFVLNDLWTFKER